METIKKHYQFTNFSHNEIIAELEKKRIKKNLSKKDFSQLAGYGCSTYSNWCSGNKGFSKKSFMAFANKYAPHLISEKTLFSTQNPLQATKSKPKPMLTTDPKTGKLKVERDWSVPKAFPAGYVINHKCRAVKVGETCGWIKNGAIGTIIPDGSSAPKFVCDDKEMYPYGWEAQENGFYEHINKLVPLNPTDHPEHPDFGKVNRVVHTKNAEVTTVDTTNTEQAPEPYKELPIPKPKHDIRDTIAEYVRKYGHELTAIELIGHLTIDKQ